MSKEPKDFQKATADRIEQIFRGGRQRRVLLSDEVGLGKTIIASEVIKRVDKLRRSVNDNMYRVVYVCSNVNIVKQNAQNLGIGDIMNVSESRLTMQHLKLHEKIADLKRHNNYHEDGRYDKYRPMPVLLIPLTPGTSLSLSNSFGNMQERALMYDILSCMPECVKYRYKLKYYFRLYVSLESWVRQTDIYSRRIKECGPEYLDKIHESLRCYEPFKEFLSLLQKNTLSKKNKKYISLLRTVFAEISLDELEPDLVIMDEFQRFSSLLDDSYNGDETLIAKKFFGDLNSPSNNKNSPLILLLSATPYKPYSTLEELNENNVDEQFRDFLQLMNFMFKDDNSPGEFKKIWEDYSTELSHASTERMDVLVARKKTAEDKMYSAVCRTERLNENLVSTRYVDEVDISPGDILSYCQMQKILEDCRNRAAAMKNVHFSWNNVPMDYVKSCPYLLSFMDIYELKKQITKVYTLDGCSLNDLPVSANRQRYLIDVHKMRDYKRIPSNNARLEYIRKILFNNHAERLLWIPASHPYYRIPDDNVFEKNKDFSKILVFSAWEMVPRMISVMLSYEAERITIGQAFHDENYFSNNTAGRSRLRYIDNSESKKIHILSHVCRYLSELYDSEEFFNKPITYIRHELKQRLLRHIEGKVKIEDVRCSMFNVFEYMLWLDGEDINIETFSIHATDILVNFAIGGPAECLYRIFKDCSQAKTCAENFITLFNRKQSAAIIDLNYGRYKEESYYEKVVDYCVMGNLQAVLDEFVHMIDENGNDKEKIFNRINDSLVYVESTVNIDTTDNYLNIDKAQRDKKRSVRLHIAKSFTNVRSDDKKADAANKTRDIFNSPFRPFVLSSTSVGQEGLDFHWYCRKIVHWNTPSNPQDLEQREGRINRYKCLAVRRNIARLYNDVYSWNDMFAKAHDDMKNKYHYSDMVPFWCLPPELIKDMGDDIEMIERIVPMYPLSIDRTRYERMVSVLSLYRLSLGQPRQEELIKMLDGVLSPEEVKKLLFNLSPIERNKDENLQ